MDISIIVTEIIQILRDDELTDSNLSSHIKITKMNVIVICQTIEFNLPLEIFVSLS